MPSPPNAPTRLKGGGTLAGADGDDWIDFLSRLGQEPSQDGCFVARNFVLDEGILPDRARSYEQADAVADHGTYEAWKGAQNGYLEKKVYLASDDQGPPDLLDPVDDPDEVPETFRYIDPQSPFLETAPNVCLVRIEEVDFVAEKAGVGADRIRELAKEVLDRRTPSLEQDLNGHLKDWFLELDQRPVFAVFWDDVSDLFGPDPSQDHNGWVDALRDRVGLAHLDPPLGVPGIDVLVFRYEARAVPRIKGTGGHRRPLVTPTVLDGAFSSAFCPSPRASATGHVVNLSPSAGMLRREVLHPRFAFRVSHLWRLGTVRRAVDLGQLPFARAMHLLTVRNETGRADYASGTDQDIF